MRLATVVKKELVDGLRDRRALLAALGFALLGPLAIASMVNAMAAAGRETALKPVRLCGEGEAPALIAHLRAAGLAIADDAAICLDLPADYARGQAAGESVRVHIRADLAAEAPTVAKLEREITAYSRSLGAKRLMARGVAPSVAAPIVVDTQSTNRVSRAASALGGVLILYIVMAPFILVFAMAADTSAGERERRSLEPLLTHPLRPFDIVAGKFAALAAVNLASMALCVGLSLFMLAHAATAELGLRIDTGFAASFAVFLRLVPLCMLVAAVQLGLGLFSKTFKEAQQTSMMLSLLPLVVGMLLLLRPGVDASIWPLAWEIKALAGPLLGSTTAVAPFSVVAGLELALVVLVLLAAARRLRSERVLG